MAFVAGESPRRSAAGGTVDGKMGRMRKTRNRVRFAEPGLRPEGASASRQAIDDLLTRSFT